MRYTSKSFLENKYKAVTGYDKSREHLKSIMGFEKLGFSDCRIIDEAEVSDERFNCRRLVTETFPEMYMPMYVLEPKGNKNNIPVIALHGHGSEGKEGLLKPVSKFNYTYAVEMVKRGYTVFVPDLCGSGERLEEVSVERGENSSCTHINNVCISMGFSLQTVICPELMGLISLIKQMQLNTDKLICIGFSGGGLTSMLLSALDIRVKGCYSSGYFHSAGSTILKNNLCGCNFIPHLWETFDFGDIASLIAPRLLIAEYNTDDPLNEAAESQIEITKKAYDTSSSDSFYVLKGKGGHCFSGLGYDILYKWSVNNG